MTRLASKDKAFRVYTHNSPVLGRRKLANGVTSECRQCSETLVNGGNGGEPSSDHELCIAQQQVSSRRHSTSQSSRKRTIQPRHEHFNACPMFMDHSDGLNCRCRFLRHSVSTPDVFADKQGSPVPPVSNTIISNQNGNTISNENLTSSNQTKLVTPHRRTFSGQLLKPTTENCQNNNHSGCSCGHNCSDKTVDTTDFGVTEQDDQDLKVIEKLLEIEAACLSDNSMSNSTDNSSDEDDD